MQQSSIRNFCIIAHIDHGKSTLADRLIELTGALGAKRRQDQLLDSMDLERERGITIKAKAMRLSYRAADGVVYQLNLIDTPGHVDFSYEVSRTIAACEGAILLVDAKEGIQAQTLANIYLAMEHGLEIIPVLNKIDLPDGEPERVLGEIDSVLGYGPGSVLAVSAKTGQGVCEVLEELVHRVPPPHGEPTAPLRALIFDSTYDTYKGVIAYVRVVDGTIIVGDSLRLVEQGAELDAMEVGYFAPEPRSASELAAGDVGFIATGLKNVSECRVGDTIASSSVEAPQALIGYRPPKPMVFAGLFPTYGDDFSPLRDAIEKLKLNDASLSYEPEYSPVLGHGFRCGFLGMLHLEIVCQRLEREFDLSLVVTAPGVSLLVTTVDGRELRVTNPAQMPPPGSVEKVEEPWVRISVITPSRFIGPLMELMMGREAVYKRTEYLGLFESFQGLGQRVQLEYELPLRSMLTTFYDQLKSRSRGYASLDYELLGYRETDLIKLDVLVNGITVDAFSHIVPPYRAHELGKALVHRLREVIPRQLFKVPIQAAIGNRVVARVDIPAKRKDVLAKCYGGDVTRKRKLLEKQKEGKRKMKHIGQVEVPKEAFLEVSRLAW